jgi:hypothetical protein
MNNHNGGNHEPVQQFDEVVSTWHQWPSATPRYFIPHDKCTYTQSNFCWFTKFITNPKHGFGTQWFIDGIKPTYQQDGTTSLHWPKTIT